MQSFPPLSSQYHHLVAVVVVGQRVSEQDEPVQQPDGAALSQRAPRSLRQLRPAKLRPVLAGKEVKLWRNSIDGVILWSMGIFIRCRSVATDCINYLATEIGLLI